MSCVDGTEGHFRREVEEVEPVEPLSWRGVTLFGVGIERGLVSIVATERRCETADVFRGVRNAGLEGRTLFWNAVNKTRISSS